MDLLRSRFALGCLCVIFIVLLQIVFLQYNLYNLPCLESTTQIFRYDTDYVDSYSIDIQQHHRRRLPTCLIIGVRKGGTRALLDAIALHPKIKVARREIHFFNNNETYMLGTEWYRQQMPHSEPDQITVEKTPGYITSRLAPKRVHRMNPRMKLLVIVRDPVVRTISDYTQVFYTKLERNKTISNFESVVFLSNSTAFNTEYKPVKNSLYAEHLQNWLKYFPISQFLIIDGDKFISNPLNQLRRVEKFLNLSSEISNDQLVFNERKGFYCFRRKGKKTARCLGNSKGRTHVPVAESTKTLLARNFAEPNRKFFALINQRFNW